MIPKAYRVIKIINSLEFLYFSYTQKLENAIYKQSVVNIITDFLFAVCLLAYMMTVCTFQYQMMIAWSCIYLPLIIAGEFVLYGYIHARIMHNANLRLLLIGYSN